MPPRKKAALPGRAGGHTAPTSSTRGNRASPRPAAAPQVPASRPTAKRSPLPKRASMSLSSSSATRPARKPAAKATTSGASTGAAASGRVSRGRAKVAKKKDATKVRPTAPSRAKPSAKVTRKASAAPPRTRTAQRIKEQVRATAAATKRTPAASVPRRKRRREEASLSSSSSSHSTTTRGSSTRSPHGADQEEVEGAEEEETSTATSEIETSLSSSFQLQSPTGAAGGSVDPAEDTQRTERGESPVMTLSPDQRRPATGDSGEQAPPPPTAATTPARHRAKASGGGGGGGGGGAQEPESKEGSPEVLTAFSDGRRSASKWQQHVLSRNPHATRLSVAETDLSCSGDGGGHTEKTKQLPPAHPGNDGPVVTSHTADGDVDTSGDRQRDAKAITGLLESSPRAISCDTVLFIDEGDDDDSQTPPPAPSSQFLSIPDGGGVGQSQFTQHAGRVVAGGGNGSSFSATPEKHAADRVVNSREEECESEARSSPPPHGVEETEGGPTGASASGTVQHHHHDHRVDMSGVDEAASAAQRHLAPSHSTRTAGYPPPRPSPPLTGAGTPSQSPPHPSATHLRMNTPSRPRTPTAHRVHSASSNVPLPPTTHPRSGFPSAPPSPSPALLHESARRDGDAANTQASTQPLSFRGRSPLQGSSPFPTASPSSAAAAAPPADLTSPATGRVSTQMITRAAAARPLASPGTLWICLDDDDDADVQEPTSLSSPVLDNIRIDTAAAAAATMGCATGAAALSGPPPRLSDEEERRRGEPGNGVAEATQQLFGDLTDVAARSRKIFRLSAGEGGGTRASHSGPAATRFFAKKEEAAEEEEGRAKASGPGDDTMEGQPTPPLRPWQTATATVAAARGTIREMLSPTFRPRRGTLHSLPPSAFIRLDDTDDDEDDEDENEEGVVFDAQRTRSSQELRARARRQAEMSISPPVAVDGAASSCCSSRSDDKAEGRDTFMAHGAGPRRRDLHRRSFASVGTMPFVEAEEDRGNALSITTTTSSSSSSSDDVKLSQLSGSQSPTMASPPAQQHHLRSGASPAAARATAAAPTTSAGPHSASHHPFIRYDDDSESDSGPPGTAEVAGGEQRAWGRLEGKLIEAGDDDEEANAPGRHPRSVKDFIFPSRHGVTSPIFPFHHEDTLPSSFSSSSRRAGRREGPKKGSGGRGRKAGGPRQSVPSGNAAVGDGDAGSGSGSGGAAVRPVDQLQQFFPKRFTRKSFHDAAQRIIPPEHFLAAGQFWDAFRSAEFAGEGSFGLVWKSCTVDGDLVAVKTCPVSLGARPNVEDAFSTLREVAVMRFLNEMQVPYVLPLHSAFLVKEREALPPLAAEALAWRRARRRRAEAAVLERQVRLLSASGHVGGSRGGGGGAGGGRRKADESLLEAEIQKELLDMAATEGPEERATRARLGAVRLPRFLSISEEDVLQCDATVMLVFELCDGDVESIPRADGVAKGVAYCVSSALAAMHELGLLHLDLKPSNILFAYEHGPSQQTPRTSALIGGGDSGGSGTGVSAISDSHKGSSSSAGEGGKLTSTAVKFYLSDFGNCRIVGPRENSVVTDAFGTFEYMDLRALRDAVCSRATDNFSLGCSLYEMLFGQRVYPKCTNPKCHSEEDHTRECFIEPASRPITLPLPLQPLPQPPSPSASSADAPETGMRRGIRDRSSSSGHPAVCHAALLQQQQHVQGDGGAAKRAAAGRTPPQGGLSAAQQRNHEGHKAQDAAAQRGTVPLTTLQRVVVALLQPDPRKRLTAAQCRDHLIRTYNITAAEGSQASQPLVDSDGSPPSDWARLREVNQTFAAHNTVPPALLGATQPQCEPFS